MRPIAPDQEDGLPLPVNNGGGKGGYRPKFQRFPQAMPGQLGLLSQQLAAGFGTPTAPPQDAALLDPAAQGMPTPSPTNSQAPGTPSPGPTAADFRKYLNNIYSPMRIQTNTQFGQRGGHGNGNGNGQGNGGGQPIPLTPQQLAQLQQQNPGIFTPSYGGGR